MKGIVFLGLIVLTAIAHGHTRLKATSAIQIRSTNPGIKSGPCGGLARSLTPAILIPGQEITVTFEETIYHPGRFEIYFSAAGEANFTLLKTIPQNASNNSRNVPHQFTATVNLPNVTCTDCTLQLIQVMLENPAVPSLYYSCADLQLKAPSQDPDTLPPTSLTPSPAPTPICPVPAS